MRFWIAIVLGLVIGGALAWWGSRPSPAQREVREREAAEYAENRMQPLYRWRDDAGMLHVTERPPENRAYERIARDPDGAIRVQGNAVPQTR